MTPTPLLMMNNASSENPFFNMMPTTPFQAGNQILWGPDSIGTIVFGVIMCILAVTALWQGRQNVKAREQDLEQGPSSHGLNERTANATDPMPIIHNPPELESERVRSQHGDGQISQRSKEVDGNKQASTGAEKKERDSRIQVEEVQDDENDVDEDLGPKEAKTIRTDTDWTLVGTEDEDEAKAKDYEI